MWKPAHEPLLWRSTRGPGAYHRHLPGSGTAPWLQTVIRGSRMNAMDEKMSRTESGEVVRAAYRAFAAFVREIDDDQSWGPTRCAGWAVRDLVFHCLSDAQRALTALHPHPAGP